MHRVFVKNRYNTILVFLFVLASVFMINQKFFKADNKALLIVKANEIFNQWQNDIEDESLISWRNKLKQFIPEEAMPYFIESNTETLINFPVTQYPTKPKSLNLIKTPTYTGTLVGIKGQYLLFEDETVFNVRSNEGLVVKIEI